MGAVEGLSRFGDTLPGNCPPAGGPQASFGGPLSAWGASGGLY